MTRRSRSTARDFPRTARLNQLIHEIVADELERIDDERLELVTVMAVDCDADLRHAVVYYDTLSGDAEDDEAVGAGLVEHRARLQSAIGRQARVRRVPELRFQPDDVGRGAARVEEILRRLDHPED